MSYNFIIVAYMLLVNRKVDYFLLLYERDIMCLVERIKTKCQENSISVKALEREIGLANGSIRRWDNQKPSYDKIILVANKLQTSFYWLITGKEAPELNPDEEKLIEYYRSSDERSKKMILAMAAAGADQEHEQVKITSSDSKIG